jgi:hypothetical protein
MVIFHSYVSLPEGNPQTRVPMGTQVYPKSKDVHVNSSSVKWWFICQCGTPKFDGALWCTYHHSPRENCCSGCRPNFQTHQRGMNIKTHALDQRNPRPFSKVCDLLVTPAMANQVENWTRPDPVYMKRTKMQIEAQTPRKGSGNLAPVVGHEESWSNGEMMMNNRNNTFWGNPFFEFQEIFRGSIFLQRRTVDRLSTLDLFLDPVSSTPG